MPASYEQGFQTGSKPGTVYLGVGPAISDLATDLSQELTDMTDDVTSIFEDPAPRYDRSHPRTIHARVDLSNTTTGQIYHQGAQPTIVEASGATITIFVNSVAVASVVIQNVGALAREYEIAWVSVANPNTTESDVLSWVLVWDVAAASAQRFGPYAHAAKSKDDTEARWGDAPGGGRVFNETIHRVGFHHRAMSLAEIVEDWIASIPAPTGDAKITREPLPLDVASELGDRNRLQGPPGAWSARHIRQLRRRTVTSRSIRLAGVELSTTYHVDNPMVRQAVGSTEYRWRLGWMWAHPIPETVSHVYCRVHAQVWVTGGAAVPTGIRLYTASRPPQVIDMAEANPYEQRFTTAVVTRDDGPGGVGEWTDLGPLEIVRGDDSRQGMSYLMLAYAIDPNGASGNDAAARAIINAVQFALHHQPPGEGQPQVPGESG